MEFRPDRAYIAAICFDGKSWSKDLPAIRLDFHISYPYLVEDEGQIYCVPETCEASELRLYRAVAFPTSWEAAGVLLPGFPAVDSTIFRFEGRWWLFATSREASDHKLFAWYADSVRGPWHPHRANPIKIDVRGSRPAGPPFWVDGSLYRPAQDCSTTYGGRIALHRITELTPTRFCEQLERFIEPDPTSPYRRGLHTLSAAGASTVIDGRCYRLRWFGRNPGFD
jgi:hypothetical protein